MGIIIASLWYSTLNCAWHFADDTCYLPLPLSVLCVISPTVVQRNRWRMNHSQSTGIAQCVRDLQGMQRGCCCTWDEPQSHNDSISWKVLPINIPRMMLPFEVSSVTSTSHYQQRLFPCTPHPQTKSSSTVPASNSNNLPTYPLPSNFCWFHLSVFCVLRNNIWNNFPNLYVQCIWFLEELRWLAFRFWF